ncbi:MAG: hypothetical protein AAF673_05875, partial [Pseudomonadota bacterium]
MEFVETMAFTMSLLLLIISFTISHLLYDSKEIDSVPSLVLFSMVLVGLSTPINILKDREHKIPDTWRNVLMLISACLIIMILIDHFLSPVIFAEYLVVPFLAISVVSSMFFIRVTKPIKRFAHQEKLEKIIATIFLIVVPLCLVSEF